MRGFQVAESPGEAGNSWAYGKPSLKMLPMFWAGLHSLGDLLVFSTLRPRMPREEAIISSYTSLLFSGVL